MLSEFASNVATAAMIMPVLISMASAIQIEPMGILFIATLASSCGVAMPVATPPNAIVYSSGKLTIVEMIKTGLVIDVISISIIAVMGYFIYYF